MRQPASYTVQKIAKLSISHRFFCVFLCVSHSASVFYGVFADSRFANATLDLHLCFSSVQGWGGMGGGDDIHANAACVFCFFCCFLCVSHFASVFPVFLPTLESLHMPALSCLCLSALCGGGGGMGGGWGGGRG